MEARGDEAVQRRAAATAGAGELHLLARRHGAGRLGFVARARRERKRARARVRGTREAHLGGGVEEEGGGEAQPESRKEAAAARVHGKFRQHFGRKGELLRVVARPGALSVGFIA